MFKQIKSWSKRNLVFLRNFIKKEGLIATLALLLSIYSIWQQYDNRRSKLVGGVRAVLKSNFGSTDRMTNIQTEYTLFCLYLQLTNTGKVPIDINMISVDALQDGAMHTLIMKTRIKDLFDNMKDSIVENESDLISHLILRVSNIDPGKSIEGFYICLGNPNWNFEYTKRFQIHCWDKLENEYVLDCDMLDDNATLPLEIVQERTGVRFLKFTNKVNPE